MAWGSANFSCKGPNSKYIRLRGHGVSVTATQLCHCSMKAALDDVQTNKHGYVPVKLYFQKQMPTWEVTSVRW